MAIYVFENTDANEAAGFQAADTLVFSNTSVNARNVVVTPGTGLNTGVTLTANGLSLAFPAANISTASIAGRVVFDDQSSLVLGTGGDNTITLTDPTPGSPDLTPNSVVYGLAGNDQITAAAGDDFIYGGAGDDVLAGGEGNDHLYGNALTTAQGATDGADSISGGDGADYIQGNAGADTLDGGAGSDRIFGGSGDDSIRGGDGQDQINGNQGNDRIDGEVGNDIIRGGQGLDTLIGGAGNDILYGDLGNDSLVGGTGFDVLFGGDGNDVFVFAAGDAPTTNIGQTGTSANLVDIIADYADGNDKIDLAIVTPAVAAGPGGVPAAAPAVTAQVLLDTSGSTFTTLQAATTFAQQLLDNNTPGANQAELAVLNVGSDAYIFAAQGGATIDTVVRVLNTQASVFNSTDFI